MLEYPKLHTRNERLGKLQKFMEMNLTLRYSKMKGTIRYFTLLWIVTLHNTSLLAAGYTITIG